MPPPRPKRACASFCVIPSRWNRSHGGFRRRPARPAAAMLRWCCGSICRPRSSSSWKAVFRCRRRSPAPSRQWRVSRWLRRSRFQGVQDELPMVQIGGGASKQRSSSMCLMCRKDLDHPFAPTRRNMLLGAAAAGLFWANSVHAKETKPPPKPENVLSPDASLKRLMEGNQRYVGGLALRHDFKHEREALAGGQNPYAAILSCADSRIAPEYAFDSGRGDLFVCRVAGNFANAETIASLEYAVAVLNVPLILVLGHDSCGAVDAAIKSLADGPLPGHMPSLVAGLAPSV